MAGFEFENKDQVIGVLAPEMSPAEAEEGLPGALALYQQRVQEHDGATEEVKQCEAVSAANKETLRFLREKQQSLHAELKQDTASSYTELFALRSDCDIEGIGAILSKKRAAIAFVDSAYNHLLLVQDPLNQIAFLDSLVKQAVAEHLELAQAALLSRMRTIAALAPVLANELGQVGIIGAGSEGLKSAAQAALKRVETAKEAARDARLAFDKAEAVRISAGITAPIVTPIVY